MPESSRGQLDPHEENDLLNGSSSAAGPSGANERDLLGDEQRPHALDESQRMTFKRRQKNPSLFPSSFLSPPRGHSRQNSYSRRSYHSRGRSTGGNSAAGELPELDTAFASGSHLNSTKDGGPLDWYVEGPGRRVAYDDLTAIDWIFEYTKERQRLSVLNSSTSGIFGWLWQLLDASQAWIVLICAGIATGLVAAAIDVVTDWMGDLKVGYCKNGPGGGKFYLNRSFCCWGLDDWTPWNVALHVKSRAGSFLVGYFFFICYSVTFAVCASILVTSYALYAKQSGIPEIKTLLGGYVIRRFLGLWTLLIKALGLCLAVGSGLWIGKEGPFVHVACCCAHLFMRMFDNINKNEARKREVISAVAAAGISVAFGSPIGGVLFSLEQLSYYFPDRTMWQSFVSAMVAAVTLQAFNPFRTGKLVLYQVTYTSGWHGFEMVPFALLGIVGGIHGGLFIRLNMTIAQWRRRLPFSSRFPVWEVAGIALLTAIINYPNPFMRAQSSELVASLFAECSQDKEDLLGLCKSGAANAVTVFLLLLASVMGFLLSSATFGLQIPAGIILPSMAIGALYGRALGIAIQAWQKTYPSLFIFANCETDGPCVTPGTYAIIGAAAALSGVTRMTVSIVVIMFELTGALTYVLPIMIAVMLSKWVGDAINKRGIYESWIAFQEYPFLENNDDDARAVADLRVGDIMTRIEDLVVITATGHTIDSLTELLENVPYRGFPVINDAREAILLGYISRAELSFALASSLSAPRSLPGTSETHFVHQPLSDPANSLDLRPWMDQTPITLSPKTNLELASKLFQRLGLRYVLSTEAGVLQGLITKKDVWYVLVSAAEEEEHGQRDGHVHGSGNDGLRDRGPEGGGLLVDDEDDDEGRR